MSFSNINFLSRMPGCEFVFQYKNENEKNKIIEEIAESIFDLYCSFMRPKGLTQWGINLLKRCNIVSQKKTETITYPAEEQLMLFKTQLKVTAVTGLKSFKSMTFSTDDENFSLISGALKNSKISPDHWPNKYFLTSAIKINLSIRDSDTIEVKMKVT